MYNEQDSCKAWQEYESGRNYQASLGLTTQIPINIDFFEGKQWGNTANLEHTKNYPRPVTNIVKMICRNKKAAVLSSPIRIVYRSDEKQGAEEFTHFANYIQNEANFEELDNEAVESAEKKGTAIYHLYWDDSAEGLSGEYKGGLRAEIIDPLCFFVANPQVKDVQKQKWIIISTREERQAIVDNADSGIDTDLIVPDGKEIRYYTDDKEQNGTELCTVLTKYFRKDGEVYYEKAVKGCVFQKARALNPNINMQANDKEDGEEIGLPSEAVKAGEQPEQAVKASLYPLVVFNWESRENSIYGISEVEDLIANQKAINQIDAIKLLIGQAQSSSKIVARDGALGDNGQEITNSPLQIIRDYSKPGIQGYYTLPPANVSPILSGINSEIMQNTRTVSGSTEVLSGEVISSQMSGSAIMALQNQANKPVLDLRSRFLRAKKRLGELFVQFFKLFYDTDKQYDYYDSANKATVNSVFNSTKFKDKNFSVVCEIGGGSVYSDQMVVQILEKLHQGGQIDTKTYIEQFPDGILPNKADLILAISEREQGEIAQLQQVLQQQQQQTAQLQQQLQQLATALQAAQKSVQNTDNVIKENMQLQEFLGKLRMEYSAKIAEANEGINAQNSILESSGIAELVRRQNAEQQLLQTQIQQQGEGGGGGEQTVPDMQA